MKKKYEPPPPVSMKGEKFDLMTLEEARIFLFKNYTSPGGVTCGCCGRKAKQYRKSLGDTASKGLIRLFHYVNAEGRHLDEYVHLEDFFEGSTSLRTKTARSMTKAKYWDLVLQDDSQKDDGNPNSGKWKITWKGIGFVLGRTKLPKYVYTYNDEVEDTGGEEVSIHDTLKEEFIYSHVVYASGKMPKSRKKKK